MFDTAEWVSTPDRIGAIALSSLFFYGFIVLLTRLSGKRTTGQMNNFDWIITIAVGSLAASGILLRNVTILDSVIAIAALFACQYAFTWIAVRSDHFSKIVRDTPTLLTSKGEYLEEPMRANRISKEEVNAALRANGFTKCEQAAWVILECDGSMSVVPANDDELKWEDTQATTDVRAPNRN